MAAISNKVKTFFLILLIIFIIFLGFFWLDYIGAYSLNDKLLGNKDKKIESVVDAVDDEPSLLARAEFEKEQQKLQERIEELDLREAKLAEKEEKFEKEIENFDKQRQGLKLEKKELEKEKKRYSGYQKNVRDLADKIGGMPPEQSVKIMLNWEDSLVIDVLRQMDANAVEAGKASITSYLISLMPKERASRIMYLMTQI